MSGVAAAPPRGIQNAPPVQPDTAALVALLEGCANPGVTRRALMVRIPDLPPELTWPHHRRLIEGALEPLLGLDRARLYRLADGTLLVAWRGAAHTEERFASETLAQLLADLPSCPVELLDLPRDTPRVARAIAGSLGPVGQAVVAPGGCPLDPTSLSHLERALAQASVASFVRHHPVCLWPASSGPLVAWERRSLSVRDLAAALAPRTRLQDDPWLFRRLTRSFDRRMLALLSSRDELRDAGPFALDLNVASIVSPEFLRFDAALPSHLRGEIVLGVLPADLLTDTAAFGFARDFARARRYRLLLRSVSLEWLGVFPADLIGVDLLQLLVPARALKDLPHGLDPARLVLNKVADQAAVDWGRDQGISLFQGAFVQAELRRGR